MHMIDSNLHLMEWCCLKLNVWGIPTTALTTKYCLAMKQRNILALVTEILNGFQKRKIFGLHTAYFETPEV